MKYILMIMLLSIGANVYGSDCEETNIADAIQAALEKKIEVMRCSIDGNPDGDIIIKKNNLGYEVLIKDRKDELYVSHLVDLEPNKKVPGSEIMIKRAGKNNKRGRTLFKLELTNAVAASGIKGKVEATFQERAFLSARRIKGDVSCKLVN